MTTQELADKLNGREYGSEITKEEAAQAAVDGLVVVFGHSDDNMELRGAIDEEVGCYDGGQVYINADGKLVEPCGEPCAHCNVEQLMEYPLRAVFLWGEYTWVYETNIPHATFDILEDGEKYCRGIVFSIKDMKK